MPISSPGAEVEVALFVLRPGLGAGPIDRLAVRAYDGTLTTSTANLLVAMAADVAAYRRRIEGSR